MIPYPYNMVDMGGIDLAEANGTVVEGLYAKIVEAVDACSDVVLYNWKFAGIEISPQHTSILLGDPIVINGAVQVTEQDEVTVPGINPDPPLPPPEPVLVPIEIDENGYYDPSDYDADGFSDVTVEIPITPAGKYQEVVPDYSGLSAGYISAAGAFQVWTAVSNYVMYATLDAGKYIVCMGEVVGDRFRVAQFPSKSFSDFEQYIQTPASSSTTVYQPESVVTPVSGLTGDGLTRRFIFQSTGGECLIMTSAVSQIAKPILLKIQEE